MTAGLVAYFLSFRNSRPFPVRGGNTATNARNYLRDIARWQRPGGQINAIWNMVDSLNAPVAQTPTTTPTPAQPAITPSCTNTKRTNIPDDYHIEIHGITGDVLQNFGTDRLSKLFKEENGCGGSNSWKWIWDNDGHAVGSVTFNLPLGMKGGCVERAFMTAAGGPQIAKCVQKHSG
jgi:chitinase